MKKLVLICGILAGVLSVGMSAMSEEEWERTYDNCKNGDKSACQALIDNGLPSVEQCSSELEKGKPIAQAKNNCIIAGLALFGAEPEAHKPKPNKYNLTYAKDAIKYFESGCDKVGKTQGAACSILAELYSIDSSDNIVVKDYHKATKLYKKGCDSGFGQSCRGLGGMYEGGKGVRQDYHKARELYNKACNLEDALACYFIGLHYYYGVSGVEENRSIAKQYYGEACDLGYQNGCDDYKALNEAGVQ
ncbi:tetratricopeptide repeat protein [Helicobacter sp. 23-1046]